jgi:hypothetical protein
MTGDAATEGNPVKRLIRPLAAAIVIAVGATPAWASDPQIEFQQSVYSYSKSTTENRPAAGGATRATDEGVTTMPTDLEIAMRKDHWEFSVFPTTPGGASFEVLNEFIPHLAVGFDFGEERANHNDDNYHRTSEAIEVGPMAEWDPLYGDQSIELQLTLNYEQLVAKVAAKNQNFSLQDAGVSTTDINSRGYEAELQAMWVQRVTDNLKVAVGGIYTYGWAHDKIANANNVSNVVELIPLQLRAGIY